MSTTKTVPFQKLIELGFVYQGRLEQERPSVDTDLEGNKIKTVLCQPAKVYHPNPIVYSVFVDCRFEQIKVETNVVVSKSHTCREMPWREFEILLGNANLTFLEGTDKKTG